MAAAIKQRWRRGRRSLLAAGLLLLAAPGANGGPPALPSGGMVTAGQAAILAADPASTVILQQSSRAVIDWQSFSVGQGGTVSFQQPDSRAITLNRVIGGQASTINGNLQANGQVWLVNREGILFGQSSRIDLGGLLATTSDIRDADFLSGRYTFDTPSPTATAAIVNKGSIKAATGGSVLMSANRVDNQGVIQARLGRVVLGGAGAFSVSFDGDTLLQYQITAPGTSAPAPDGAPASAPVSNSGTISAQGGQILMTARAARDVFDHVVNTSGIVEATSVSIQGGEVVLDGGDGGVAISGVVDASGLKADESGGTIRVRGANVEIADGARLDASGAAKGGDIAIGSAVPDPEGVVASRAVTVAKASIAADSSGGKGGTITILSAGRTAVAAALSARGKTGGGAVETSGPQLAISGDAHVDTSAASGVAGTWLLDPVDVDIDSTLAGNIVSSLSSTNVNVTASHDITVNAPLVYSSANTLALLAGHDLVVNQNLQNSGAGNVIAVAGWDGVTAAASIRATASAYGNGGSLLIGGGASTDVALGSRNGTTMVAAQDLTLQGVNGWAQLGFHGSNTTGLIDVVLKGNLVMSGGSIAGALAQIGHGVRGSSGNYSGDIKISAAGSVTLTRGSGSDAFAGIGNFNSFGATSSGTVSLSSVGDITLNSGTTIDANASGDALVLASGGNFVNQAGSGALDAGVGRWLVFLNSPSNNTPGGLSASPFYDRVFDFSVNSYSPVTSSGNRFVYQLAPVVTVTVGNQSKIYGGANPAFSATIAGGLPGDAASSVYTGAPALTTLAAANSPVGDYAITGGLGTLASDFNYRFQFVDGTLHVSPATLTASLTGAVRKAYDGTTTAPLSGARYSLAGVLFGDNVSVAGPTNGNFSSPGVGAGKLVSVTGLSLQGAASANYSLAAPNAAAAIGTIDPAILTVVLTGSVRKIYDGSAAAPLFGLVYQLAGLVPGEAVTVSGPASGSFDSKNVGTGKAVLVKGLSLAGAGSGNYLLASPNVTAAVGVIDPASVTITLTGTVEKVFDGTTSALLDSSNLALGNALAGDQVFPSSPLDGLYDSRDVGSGKIVSVTGLSLVGADSGNYVLTSTSASGAVGVITPNLAANVLGNSYTVNGALALSSVPLGAPASNNSSSPSSAVTEVALDEVSDAATAQIGRSLSASSSQSSSTVLIDGLLRQFGSQPGYGLPRAVPPYGEVYSSWGNEAFWQ